MLHVHASRQQQDPHVAHGLEQQHLVLQAWHPTTPADAATIDSGRDFGFGTLRMELVRRNLLLCPALLWVAIAWSPHISVLASVKAIRSNLSAAAANAELGGSFRQAISRLDLSCGLILQVAPQIITISNQQRI